jgi:hypothetical protein
VATPADKTMTPEQIKQLRERAHKLYGRQNIFDQCDVSIDKNPTVLRHEDPQLGGSGWWVDVAVFVPDEKER